MIVLSNKWLSLIFFQTYLAWDVYFWGLWVWVGPACWLWLRIRRRWFEIESTSVCFLTGRSFGYIVRVVVLSFRWLFWWIMWIIVRRLRQFFLWDILSRDCFSLFTGLSKVKWVLRLRCCLSCQICWVLFSWVWPGSYNSTLNSEFSFRSAWWPWRVGLAMVCCSFRSQVLAWPFFT